MSAWQHHDVPAQLIARGYRFYSTSTRCFWWTRNTGDTMSEGHFGTLAAAVADATTDMEQNNIPIILPKVPRDNKGRYIG